MARRAKRKGRGKHTCGKGNWRRGGNALWKCKRGKARFVAER